MGLLVNPEGGIRGTSYFPLKLFPKHLQQQKRAVVEEGGGFRWTPEAFFCFSSNAVLDPPTGLDNTLVRASPSRFTRPPVGTREGQCTDRTR